MAEHEEWQAADDARVRAALGALRADVEAVPLSDPRFVRARGARLRRQRMVGWTAAAAAAVVVAGTVGYAQLARDTTLPTPPARTPTTTTTTPPASSLDQPGTLPLLAEWASAFDVAPATLRLTPVKPFEAVECLDVEPGTKVQQESITGGAGTPSGGQVRFRLTSGSDTQTAASGVADDIADCEAGPGFRVGELVETPSGRIYPYTAGDAGSGWFVVVPGIRDVVVLQVVEPGSATPRSSTAVQSLATVARERLLRYAVPQATATPSSPTTTGPRALDEKMPVSGPDPKPSSALFVAASQWTSPFFGQGARAYAGEGATEGSTTVITCETDEQQAGVAGRVGVVSIRAGAGDANHVGKQRVRVFDDVQGYELVQADLQRIDRLVTKGCTSAGGANRTTAERGPVQGTYLLTTRVTGEATGTMYQWVGVTGMQTEGAVSTIVFHGTDDGQGFQGSKAQGFAELVRLMDLARQK